jgi:HSP20 family protein
MALIRFEPVRELDTLQREMNRLFGAAFDEEGGAREWLPAMDLVEEDDALVLRADLPGVEERSISVEFQENVLTISGERQSEAAQHNGGYRRIERPSGAFLRSLELPEGIDPDSVKASFTNGVLEVRVPKPEERKPRRVAINVGDTPGVIEGGS